LYWELNDTFAWQDRDASIPSETFSFIIEYSADCNGDGMVDYGQILNGELTDDDGNGVPDCCDEGTTCLAAVQWRVEDGGNGNWYSFAISDSPLCWYEFADHAQSMGGELASLETEPEFDFAKQVLFNGPNLNEKIFVGLEQSPEGDASGPDQGWFWLSGAPLSFDPWDSSVDDAAGCQDVAGFRNASSPLLDDVYPCDDSDCPHGTYSTGGIVEWSADCNGDGMVDYGQILSGELTDDDGNGVPDVCEECPGDIIEDGVVNLVDFSQFLIDFGSTGESISDLNGDLVVDLNDFSIFLVNYGNVCETRSAVAETGVGKVAPTHHIGGVPRRSMN